MHIIIAYVAWEGNTAADGKKPTLINNKVNDFFFFLEALGKKCVKLQKKID